MAEISLGKVFMTPKGVWDSTKQYQSLDIVMVRGATSSTGYISTDVIPANTPINDKRWKTLFVVNDGEATADFNNKVNKVNANKKAIDTIYAELQKMYGVQISDTEPTEERTGIWVDTSSTETFSVPEIKDNVVNTTDTWSSQKINQMVSVDSYATKSGACADDDRVAIYDSVSKTQKKTLFGGGVWNWIVNKLTNAVISNLQTNNKTVLGAINELNSKSHNIPRIVPKDITSYYNDGSLWKRLEGSGGYSLFEDLFVGDYLKMSRHISALNPAADYQLTGSQYVTIASLGGLAGNGDNTSASDKWAVMVPGMGFGGTQHFGRSRMNPTNTTVGGYKGSEMNTTVIGEVATTGSTAAGATINQQLFAEFGSHLKTTRELITNSINATGVNKFGTTTGCSNNWEWISMQAVLMSEIEVYGSCIFSSSGYDTGTANHQFELFAFSENAINNRSAWYFLKDVASTSRFCDCDSTGYSGYVDASAGSVCVRPRFVIGA